MARRIVCVPLLDLSARESEGLAEAEPELGVILAAALFFDEILEQELARRDVVGVRVHRADERRKRHRVMKILRRIVAQLFARQRAARPALIERVIEKMLGRDACVEGLNGIHRVPPSVFCVRAECSVLAAPLAAALRGARGFPRRGAGGEGGGRLRGTGKGRGRGATPPSPPPPTAISAAANSAALSEALASPPP